MIWQHVVRRALHGDKRVFVDRFVHGEKHRRTEPLRLNARHHVVNPRGRMNYQHGT